jgi:hypothetical protein
MAGATIRNLPASALYAAVVDEVRRLIVDRRRLFLFADDAAPMRVTFVPKPNQPAPVRVEPWWKIQAALDVFCPDGVEVGICPAGDVVPPAGSIPVLLSQGSRSASLSMNELRTVALAPSRRSKIARAAARARWGRRNEAA